MGVHRGANGAKTTPWHGLKNRRRRRRLCL